MAMTPLEELSETIQAASTVLVLVEILCLAMIGLNLVIGRLS